MADEDDASKTEEPSDRKLANAREKGQVAQSQEIKSWIILLAGLISIVSMGPYMARQIRDRMTYLIEQPHTVGADFEQLLRVLADLATDVGLILSPFLLLTVVAAIMGNVGQFGLTYSTEKIQPDINKLSVIKGFKRMFSMKALVEFLKGIAKLVIVAAAGILVALPLIEDVELIPFESVPATLERLYIIIVMLGAATVTIMTVVAALDFSFQKYSFMQDMRMSKQEVKDEHKQTEGDPQVKARIRSLRQERARQRMMAAVPEADVVVTNPTHFAIAMKYDMETMPAPKVVAKGVDNLALRIRELAEEHDVTIIENPPLARALYAAVEIDEEIPPEHFKAVAEIIGFVMRRRGKLLQ